MKKLLVSLLFVSCSLFAKERDQTNTYMLQNGTTNICMPIEELSKLIRSYDEMPIFHGKSDYGFHTIIFLNTYNYTYTIVNVSDNEKIGCVILFGVKE